MKAPGGGGGGGERTLRTERLGRVGTSGAREFEGLGRGRRKAFEAREWCGQGPEKRLSTYTASALLAWPALGLEGRSEVASKRASAAESGLRLWNM